MVYYVDRRTSTCRQTTNCRHSLCKKKHVDIKSPANTSIFVDMKIYCRQEKKMSMTRFRSEFGPLEASRGQTKQTMNYGRNQSCVWQVGAGWKRPTDPEVINHDNITQGRPENTHSRSSGPLEASGGLWSQNQTVNSRNKSCV